MKSDKKIVTMKFKEFENMIKLIKELRKANGLLNKQIKEYNKKFTKGAEDGQV